MVRSYRIDFLDQMNPLDFMDLIVLRIRLELPRRIMLLYRMNLLDFSLLYLHLKDYLDLKSLLVPIVRLLPVEFLLRKMLLDLVGLHDHKTGLYLTIRMKFKIRSG